MNRLLPALTLSLFALTGCSFVPGSGPAEPENLGTPGTEGHVHFNYAPHLECPSSDCSSMKAMMVGTTEAVTIAEDVQFGDLVVTAEDPAVLGVSFEHSEFCCVVSEAGNEGGCFRIDAGAACSGDRSHSYEIEVDALSAGQTNLLLKHSADGSLFDSVPLRVERPAALSLSCEQSDDSAAPIVGSLSLSSAAPCALRARTSDAAGAPLQASLGFVIATADAQIARVDSPFIQTDVPPPAVNTATATLAAVSPGATELTVSAGDLTTTIAVTVQ